MKIVIGSDHGAVALKEEVKMVLKEFGDIEIKDVGTFGTESVDYPDIAEKVCGRASAARCARMCTLPACPGHITMPMCWPWAAGSPASARLARSSASG